MRSQSRAGAFSFYAVGRLKPGITLPQAQSNMGTIADNLQHQYPDILDGYGLNLVPIHDQVVGKTRPALLVLLGTVIFVLFIACANVANLLLARAASRERELAIRTALGAGRGRLVRQLLTESTLLAVAGGAVGVLLASWGLKALIAIAPEDIPRLDQVGIDGRVLLLHSRRFAADRIVFGLAPALSGLQFRPQRITKGRRAKLDTGERRSHSQHARCMEIALSLMLLIGAGLMIKSFQQLQDVEHGFQS